MKKHGSLSLACAKYFTAQIVDAVQWMHDQGVLHRDMKPENILLDSELRIKITDFGSAFISKDLDLCMSSCLHPSDSAAKSCSSAPQLVRGKSRLCFPGVIVSKSPDKQQKVLVL